MRKLPWAFAAAIFLAIWSITSADAGTPTPEPDDSPYEINIGAQLPGQPIWQRGFDTMFASAEKVGMHWALVDVTWSDVQQLPGKIDFSGPDQVVISAHSHHINLIIQVETTGDWGLTLPAQALATGGYRTNLLQPPVIGTKPPLANPHTAAPMNIEAAIPFWTELVERYHPHGSLAQQQGWNDSWGVTHYEVENEPDSFPWINGNWEIVTKDYGLYLAHLAPKVKAIDPSVRLLGPALSTGGFSARTGPLPNTGLTWLDTLLSASPMMLTYASDQYRQARLPSIGAGPFIDVYSFHCDFVDPSTNAHVVQSEGVREVIARYNTQAGYPTDPNAQAWCTEGSATLSYNTPGSNQRYAWAQVQYATEMLGGGVPRFNWDFAGNPPGEQVQKAAMALTSFFPSGSGVVSITDSLTALAGQKVFGYQWTNPATGLKSNVMWAQDAPALQLPVLGSGLGFPLVTTPPPFTIQFPVATSRALIVNPHDWTRTAINVVNHAVPVPLNRADPSPPYMVIECSSAGC
jgi:hypothetical protein